MKVAILTPLFHGCEGISRVAKQQAEALNRSGDDVTIFTLSSKMDSIEGVKVEIIGCPKKSLLQRICRLLLPLDIIKTIKYLQKLKNYDLMISHHYPMNWLAYLTKKFFHVKYIYYNHPIMPSSFVGKKEKLYLKIVHFMTKITVKNVDSVISISHFARNEFKNETGIDSIVIYNKIDTEKFNSLISNIEIKKRDFSTKDPTILFVGQIQPHKSIHLLIDAFFIVKTKIRNAKLLIVGKSSKAFRDYLIKLKDMSDDSVNFVGYVGDKELAYYYSICDVYATASLWEGFNLPLIEAMACSKPVVAFNIGPHKEIVNEKVGVLVAAGDTNALAEAIIEVIGNPDLAQKMGRSGYEHVKEKFTWEKSPEDLSRILKML